MSRRIISAAALFGAVVLGSIGGEWVRAADAPATQPGGAPDMAAMQKAWEEASRPGKEHAMLAKMAGEWDVQVVDSSMGMPMTSKGTATFRVILNGRYLVQEFQGQMMGQPFSGMGIVGFDNMKKKYVETWIDSSSTGIFQSEGEANDKGEIVTIGKMSMPGLGEMTMRSVGAQVDDNTHTYTMFSTGPDGAEKQCMKMTYTRKKS